MDGGIATLFANITWIATVASDWADQIFDGDLNPYAFVASGLLSIDLPPAEMNGDEDSLVVDGGLRSYTSNIALTSDEIDFLGGASSVRGSGTLTIQAATDAWTYRAKCPSKVVARGVGADVSINAPTSLVASGRVSATDEVSLEATGTNGTVRIGSTGRVDAGTRCSSDK